MLCDMFVFGNDDETEILSEEEIKHFYVQSEFSMEQCVSVFTEFHETYEHQQNIVQNVDTYFEQINQLDNQ